MALSHRCPIYDGDPRLGGAQGAGGPIRMRYRSDPGTRTQERREVRVTVAQAEMPKVISEIVVALVATPAGWRVDDLSPRDRQSYRAALAEAYDSCRAAPR